MKKLLSILLLVTSTVGHALVDYSDTVSEKTNNKMIATESPSQIQKDRSNLIWKSDFSFSTNYEISNVESEKVGILGLNGHLQTPANVFFDFNYWTASASETSNGNPKFILGFNWFRVGNPSDEARVDIFGGGKFKSNSKLASSRNDKIFGLETIKRFGPFGIGIGYEITLTGVPSKEEDTSIGNIHKISFSSGWIVSNDIQFEFEFENYKISKSTLDNRVSYLDKDMSFSCFSPKLNLQLFPSVSLELGARYRTNRPNSKNNLSSMKLLDIHGLNSNSLFTGLAVNF